jgi:hypothetical protein
MTRKEGRFTMIKLSKTLAVLLLAQVVVCMSTVYSSAAEEPERKWISYMRNEDTSLEYFYDKDALVKTSKNVLQVWRKRVFAPGSAQKEIVTFDQIDCREAEYRSLQLSVTYWDGTAKTFDKVSPWAHVYTNSAEEYLMDQHCK